MSIPAQPLGAGRNEQIGVQHCPWEFA